MELTYPLLSVDTTKEFNKVPMAELKFADGSAAEQEFPILDDDFFLPGKRLEIFLKDEGDLNSEAMVFAGIVVNHAIEHTENRLPILTVELCDEALKMTSVRKNVVFKAKKDKEIISALVTQNKLKAGTLAETGPKHGQMVQYYVSDWDFMLSRAEANGQVVIVNDGGISTVQPKIEDPSLAVEFGIADTPKTIVSFDLQLNGRRQYHNVSSVGWNINKQELTTPSEGEDYKLGQNHYDISNIAAAVGAENAQLVHAVPVNSAELQSWSDAQIMKSRLSMLRGTIKIKGNGNIEVGQTVEIQKTSRFSGKYVISGIRHGYTVKGGWYTYLQIGMEADWFTTRSNVMDTQAAGLLPGVNGLQVGVVEAYEEDPDNQFRVRVSIPAFGAGQPGRGTVWARLASIDAGAKRGVFFRPEKGDEVVVGFLNDDPRQAVILGAMHSQANVTPATVNEKNGQKGIFTKFNYQLLFDEENELITLSTPGKNQICIDEKNGRVSLSDAHENKIELSSKGVIINSAKDFQIKACGNVKIDGKKIDLI